MTLQPDIIPVATRTIGVVSIITMVTPTTGEEVVSIILI
jgi:hypothetical protein